MDWAARSLSRMATKARPVLVRMMFLPRKHRQHGEKEDEVEHGGLAVENQSAQTGRRHRQPRLPAGQLARQVEDGEVEDVMGGDGGHDQVEALDAHRRQAEDDAHQAGGQAGAGNGQPEGQMGAGGQDAAGVRPDAHEGELAHGDQAAVPGQDVEAHDGHHPDADLVDHAQPGVVQKQRQQEHQDQESDQQSPLGPAADHGAVLPVMGVKLTARNT